MSLCPTVCGPFSSVTCCINIVVQTSLRAICLESQSTSVELTCENSQLCRGLCRWTTVLLSPAPTVGKGIEFQIHRSSQTHSTLLNTTQIEFVDNSKSIPQLSRAGRVGFHTFDPVVYVSWKPLKSWTGILPWHMAHGWKEAKFLKGPLLVSLQNSGAYGFVSIQFTAQDIPAISKKSSHGSTGEVSANLNSNNTAKFGWTFLR